MNVEICKVLLIEEDFPKPHHSWEVGIIPENCNHAAGVQHIYEITDSLKCLVYIRFYTTCLDKFGRFEASSIICY